MKPDKLKEDTHMDDLPPYRDPSDDTRVGPGTPRWVKVFAIMVIVLVVLVGIIMFTGIGGQHGPGRHMPSGDAGGQTPPSSVMEDYTSPGADFGGQAALESGNR
jgi:hypothetical protein